MPERAIGRDWWCRRPAAVGASRPSRRERFLERIGPVLPAVPVAGIPGRIGVGHPLPLDRFLAAKGEREVPGLYLTRIIVPESDRALGIWAVLVDGMTQLMEKPEGHGLDVAVGAVGESRLVPAGATRVDIDSMVGRVMIAGGDLPIIDEPDVPHPMARGALPPGGRGRHFSDEIEADQVQAWSRCVDAMVHAGFPIAEETNADGRAARRGPVSPRTI